MAQSNSTSSSNIPYSKLSDNSQKEKQKPESQWKIILGQTRFHTPDYLTIVKKMNQREKIILVNILLTLNPFPNNKIIKALSSK